MKGILVGVLLLAMFCTACSTAWVSTVDSILAVAAPALINILEIVAVANGQPLDSVEVAKINTDVSALQTLASDFANASPANAAGICAKLQGAISVYQQEEELILSIAQVSDANTQNKIALLSGLVEGTVNSILAVIPPCHATQNGALELAAAPSVKKFVVSYNAILTAKTGDAAVDALTAKRRLYGHSKLVRTLSLGRLE